MHTRKALTLLLTLTFYVNNSNANNDSFLSVGITSSLNKVFQAKPYEFKGQYTDEAFIELAQNEYEAIQLVLFPLSNIKGTSIQISPLLHDDKSSLIPKESIEINPVGYVYQKAAKEISGRTGYHPDVLLPNQPLNLQKDIPQPVFITVYAAANSIPGNYHSTVTIRNSEGYTKQIKLTVTVHDIRIPHQPRFKSLSLASRHNLHKLWPEKLGYKKLDGHQQEEAFMKIADNGFRHCLPPTGFLINGLVSYNARKADENNTFVTYPTHNKKTGKYNTETVDRYINYLQQQGANSFFIGITSDIYKYDSRSKQREITLLKYLDDLIPHLKKRGILEKSYLYNIDEPWGVAVDHAKKIYRLVKQRYGSDIHVMQNTNQNNDRILDEFKNYFQAIDINLGFYDVTKLDDYRKKYPLIFNDVWWNINQWPRTHPNLFLEYPLMDARIIGLMSFKYNIHGFEYWELTYIKKIDNYHPVAADDFQLNWAVGNNSLDGLLLYPNNDYGFYSSMRLASFRDGMEDIELLYLLQQRDPDNPLLHITMINGINDYTNDIQTISDFRKKLFSALTSKQ